MLAIKFSPQGLLWKRQRIIFVKDWFLHSFNRIRVKVEIVGIVTRILFRIKFGEVEEFYWD